MFEAPLTEVIKNHAVNLVDQFIKTDGDYALSKLKETDSAKRFDDFKTIMDDEVWQYRHDCDEEPSKILIMLCSEIARITDNKELLEWSCQMIFTEVQVVFENM